METLVMAIGVILIVEGSLNLLSALYTVIAVKRFLKSCTPRPSPCWRP